jgi:replicative DNA helicase
MSYDVRELDTTSIDRTPPQDLLAEQSVLGAMMTSKDAIASVLELVKGRDFYRPAHELIFDAILDLYGKGEPADAVTVANELTRRGELARCGGHVYIHDLLASVAIAANASYYADIVREKAVLRRLVEASIKIAQMGYQATGEVSDIVDQAQQIVYEVAEGKTSEDYRPLSELIEPTWNELEAISSRNGRLAGVPTGFADLDDLTNGLHSGQMVIIAARPAIGKALALDTPLATPTGWTTMGEVAVGDLLLDAEGRPTRVVAATDVMVDRPCYRITFSDGSEIIADADHQWRATDRAARRATAERRPATYHHSMASRQRLHALAGRSSGLLTKPEIAELVGVEFTNALTSVCAQVGVHGREWRRVIGPERSYDWRSPVYETDRVVTVLRDWVDRPIGLSAAASHPATVTTADMAKRVRLSDGRCNWAVRVTEALKLPEQNLPLHPYALGVWLGDGHSAGARFTSVDPEIGDRLRSLGYLVVDRGIVHSLRLPEPDVQGRACEACGEEFLPSQAWVRTCGRACGGKVRGVRSQIDVERLSRCPDCGLPYAGGRRCADCTATHGSVQAILRTLGLLGSKHIPGMYLRASIGQRRELLRGLLDTDGTVTSGGSVQLTFTDKRLVDDAYELIVSLGYRCSVDTKSVKGRTVDTSIAYMLNFTAEPDVFALPRKRDLVATRRGTDPVRLRYVTAIEAVPSVPVRCVQVDNADHMYLAGRSMVPTHNSTLALDFARSASIKNNLTTAIFSLEMSASEIMMRLLSAEAGLLLHKMRNGSINDDDWDRLAKTTGKIQSAPLFIDDSPNLTMMEIRAKARRLKQRHDLKLVIIDYLQLMTSGKKVENRQVEVSEFSRSIKLLAKELEIPVIAISQLNRGSEQRGDKKPMLSDLRESGCLTAETRILRADTGAEVTLGELLVTGASEIPVWSVDDSGRLVARPMTHAFPSGRKATFRMRLASGREIEATSNHPFLTYDGWLPLGEVTIGTRIAIPRKAPEPLEPVVADIDELTLLAHLIGDGSFVKRQPIRYASIDEENLRAVTEAAERRFGITAIRDDDAAARVTTLRLPAPYRLTHGRRNPIAQWLDKQGLFGLRSHEKFIPGWVASVPRPQLGHFLRHLWATDGSIRWDPKNRQGRIYYATTSRRLADDVMRLLLRYGIVARLKTVRKEGYRDCFHVTVDGVDQQRIFCHYISAHGKRGQLAADLERQLTEVKANTNLDTVPVEVWTKVKKELAAVGTTHREFAAQMGTAFCGSPQWKHAPSRSRLSKIAAALHSADLEAEATNDIYWDRIVAIDPIGERDVYDATVIGTHNFIANGIAVHNSLEQDADMVILVHREDAYNKDERPGEADLMVVKHRNGATKNLTVTFQGHYSRFVDMQYT